ncbi:tetraacyldisaccharide 4'-kinase [Owenweeksia hongkongensis DSM 17368]|uniref:Tetraacyldisaccharide 4'-kinase n=1 Tax=Owenweeksia hongkongensis (strain DSM 17368 / CIP 108786 / JCM 12287 / NRRL B-23963 / UST20020801) TaxID=926562 RepID=G8R6J5_OWEHD|nr:tetraacyldisaccharide 4'-kinase [Owenweeksia hongkongensis]AEV34458.1 tetraacyldisaccharide 4'-kinase [Owenweeksia hongkongensis DSM 17368]
MNLRKLLYPFSFPYGAITALRNWAFNKDILPSQEFKVPVISVGNLSAGGTGKTPMVEFLIRRFSDYKVGLVSRGYGRKTKGLILAKPQHTFSEIGDEPFQIFNKFPEICLALAEKRPEGVQALIENCSPDLILLDDAYQHRYVKPGFQILLTTFQEPFYHDLLLPAGNLREYTSGKKRANVIVVTKCPANLTPAKAKEMMQKIKPGDKSVYFTTISYSEPQNVKGEKLGTKKVIALTGIAKPQPFLNQIGKSLSIQKHLKFADHHSFSAKEIADIEKMVTASGTPIITTEKDWVRLKSLLNAETLEHVFYLPMQVQFLFDQEQDFTKKISGYLQGV